MLGAATLSQRAPRSPRASGRQNRPAMRHLALRSSWLLLLMAAGALAALAAVPAWAQTVTVRSALAAPGDGQAFPADATARPVTLPDEWAQSRPGFSGTVWYRIGLQSPTLPGEGELLALAIEQVCSNFEAYLNGHLVASGGRMREPVTHQCHHPQLITLPAALFVPGTNTLDLKVTGHARAEVGSRWRAGGLSALKIGPRDELAPAHQRLEPLAAAMAQGTGATLLLLGGFMFVLGFVHRDESHLAYFGALAVAVAALDLRHWLQHVPFTHQVAEFLLLAGVGFAVWGAVQFLLRHAGMRSRLADAALPLQCGAIPMSLLLAGPERLGLLANVWYVVLALEVLVAAAWNLRQRWAFRSGRLLAAALGAVALALGYDALAQWREAYELPLPLTPMVLPLALMLIGLRLIQQHGRTLQHAHDGKQQFEQRIRDATAEIERNFRQLADLKLEQVTERERKRIAADLHDDLGAKLLTIVHTSDSERISSLAREALEEMRLSVRGLTGKPVRLTDALGDWRAETVARLGQAGIEGEWVAPEDMPQQFSSRAYVQTTRILREATSNIIKHSNATHCSVRCTIADGDFLLVIQDNGGGIAAEVDGRLDRGHGLASMKNRAKALQGQCLVESGPGYGTVIRLTIPLDRAAGSSGSAS
jgi:two-component system sensor histidine kinase UhpB